jgi:hypothetical protein
VATRGALPAWGCGAGAGATSPYLLAVLRYPLGVS